MESSSSHDEKMVVESVMIRVAIFWIRLFACRLYDSPLWGFLPQ